MSDVPTVLPADSPALRPTAEAIRSAVVTHVAPPPRQGVSLDVKTIGPGETVSAVFAGPIAIVETHWLCGRSWPHLSSGCICSRYTTTPKRLKGYVLAALMGEHKWVVLELPERVLRQASQLASPEGYVGKLVKLVRDTRRNGRVKVVSVEDRPSSMRAMTVPEVDPLDVMAEVWASPDRVPDDVGGKPNA